LHENCRSSEAKDTRHGWTRFFFQLIKPKEITVYSFAWFSKNQDQTRQAKKTPLHVVQATMSPKLQQQDVLPLPPNWGHQTSLAALASALMDLFKDRALLKLLWLLLMFCFFDRRAYGTSPE
jgi:hypothetical protein